MNSSKSRNWMVALSVAFLVVAGSSSAQAFDAFPVITDPNADGLVFGGVNAWADNPPFSVDDTAVFLNNDFLVYSWSGTSGNNGAGFAVSLSNGENGIDTTFDGVDNLDQNDDVPNTESVNAAIAAANAGGKLQNGNVIRFSTWMRQDPAAPVTVVPEIETVLKAEFWKEALSENQDSTPNQDQPLWGDKIYDVDQHGGMLGIPAEDQADWVDIDDNGNTSFGLPVSASLTTDAWTLVEHVHTINDADWFGIDDDIYSVADVEEIRLTLFMGDWSGGSLGVLSAIWVDNIFVEVFADAASVTPNMNPMPVEIEFNQADFDTDGDVDGDDFLAWQSGFGTTSGALKANGDYDNDEDVDGDDFLGWQASFGLGEGAAAATAVPEPATGALALLAALMGIYWWRC